MLFLRFFFITFLLSSSALALTAEDWEEDKKEISSMLIRYRDHYLAQSLELARFSQAHPRLVTPEVKETLEACKTFLTWNFFQTQLERTSLDIPQIIGLLRFPFEERDSLSNKIASSRNDQAKNIYREAIGLMNMIHASIQQYFQQDSDRVRSSLGYTTGFESDKITFSNDAFKKYLKMEIETEKSMFWLPSRQRQPEVYLRKIRFLEGELLKINRKRLPQEEKDRVAAEPSLTSQSQLLLSMPEERKQDQGPEEKAVTAKEGEIEAIIEHAYSLELDQREEDEVSDGALEEWKSLQRDYEEQYAQDRLLKKRGGKKRSSPEGSASLESQKEDPEKAGENLKDSPVLKRIFSLDVTLKFEEFLSIFTSLKLRIDERAGGIAVWFNEKIYKVFHRPHVRGGVVPYPDLVVAKRSLKDIDITPTF